MFRYAQIDSEGRVVSDSYLSAEVSDALMIAIPMGFDLSNKRYEGGEWKEYEQITSDGNQH